MIQSGSIVKLTDRMVKTMTRGCAPMRRTTRGVNWQTRRGTVRSLASNHVEALVLWDGAKVVQYWALRALEEVV